MKNLLKIVSLFFFTSNSYAIDARNYNESSTGGNQATTLASIASRIITPIDFGAVGDGVTDDTAKVQAAINASHDKTLYLGNYTYCVTPLTINVSVTIIGPSHNMNNYGFKFCPLQSSSPPADDPKTLLNFTATAHNSKMSNVFIGARNGRTSFPGSAIRLQGQMQVLEDVSISGACIGLDVNGNNDFINRLRVTAMSPSPNCGGIRIGHSTTQAGTIDPHITNSLIEAYGSGYGMRIEDCGGCWIGRNDILGATVYNTWIIPGSKQNVDWAFFVDTVLSDTPENSGVLIDTDSPTATIRGLQFTGTWASNAQKGSNIIIQNTANGMVSGVHFVSHRSYGGSGNAINVSGNVKYFSLSDSQICAYGAKNTGVYLQKGVTNAAIRDNIIGGDCDGIYGPTSPSIDGANGVTLVGNNNGFIITGNDLHANGTPLNLGSMLSGIGGSFVIKNNLGVDDVITAVNGGSLVKLPASPIINLTATSTIMDMTGGWQSRQITILPKSNMLFATGSSMSSGICRNYQAQIGVPIIATYTQNCWSLK